LIIITYTYNNLTCLNRFTINIPENRPTANEVQKTEVANAPLVLDQLKCLTVNVVRKPANVSSVAVYIAITTQRITKTGIFK
jgi:hypothetical protein